MKKVQPSINLKIKQIRIVDAPESLAKTLDNARRDKSLSVLELCAKAGISRTLWYKIIGNEIDEGVLGEQILRALEAVLEVDCGVKFD